MGSHGGIAQCVWDQIQECVEHDDFDRTIPNHVHCIDEMDDEIIEYFPHPGKSNDKQIIPREDFDSRLSRLRKRFR